MWNTIESGEKVRLAGGVCGRGVSASVVAAVAGAAMMMAPSARGVDKWWNVGSGNWGTGANWFTAGVPNNTDDVYVGNTVAAVNAFVQLNVNATVASLSVTDGMRVETNTSKLTVTGTTLLSGSNTTQANVVFDSLVRVEQGPSAVDFQTGTLTIANGASLWIDDGGTAQVAGLLDLQDTASIYGDGVLNLTSNAAVAMRVDGTLQAATTINGLTINQLGTGRVDLDGSVAEGQNRIVNVTGAMNDESAFANLTINGVGLSDAFDDTIWIGGGNTLTMNLTDGWTLGPAGTIRLLPSLTQVPTVEGSRLTVQGRVWLSSTNRDAEMTCPMTLEAGGVFELAAGSRLYTQDAMSIRGGSCSLASGSTLFLSGPSDWNGTLNVMGTGLLMTHGDAVVSGPTTINVHTMKLDGSGGTEWNVQNPLTINATIIDHLALPALNMFGGVMNVSGGPTSRLTINLANPGDVWTMSGEMNLTAPAGPATTRLAGTLVSIEGDLNISGSVGVSAGYGLSTGSMTTFANAASTFENSGSALVLAGAGFAGGGSLVCGASGSIRMGDGADLGSARLTNRGDLEIAFGVGQATVGGFSQTATGTYHVDIGGYVPGTRHDRLVVGGTLPASLGGMVQVDLVDAGDGFFVPQIGDQFTILTSRFGLQGAFAGVSPTLRNGVLYEWSLVYGPMTVEVRLDSTFVRCPADFNGDGFVDGFDYDDFVACFEGEGCPPGKSADFNGDGFADGFDYDDFVTAFEAGC